MIDVSLHSIKKEKLKRKLESSLYEFVKYRFQKKYGFQFVENWHHKLICLHLEDVYFLRKKNIIFNLPPRYSKTDIIVKAFSEWCIAKDFSSKFIHLTYSEALALDNSSEIREDIKSEWFQDLWAVKIKKDSDSKFLWKTKNNGGFFATGTQGSITGFGAGSIDEKKFSGAIVIDDPHKPEDANSDDIRKKDNDRLNSTIQSRRNSRSVPVIIVMQRLHHEDMTGFCLTGGMMNEVFFHVLIPAIDESGRALWPFKHTLEELREMESSNASVFSGQYQQAPSIKKGNIIERDWIKYYDVLPQLSRIWISLDCSFKSSQKSDYVVFQVWGQKGAEFFCIHMIRSKMNFPTTKETFIQLCEDFPKARAKIVEVKANGQAIVDSLKDEISGIIEVSPSESKEARLSSVAPLFKAGNVLLPRKSSWTGIFVEEICNFPFDKNDDIVDCCSQALDYGFENKGSFFGVGVVKSKA